MFAVACSTLNKPTEPRFTEEESIALDQTNWSVVYDGGGRVSFHPNGISLQPRSPRTVQETAAALVVSRFLPREPEYRLRIRYLVDSQLRRSDRLLAAAPRPWEVFWLFWDYRVGVSPTLKESRYFILKPNGVEFGQASGETDQVFLATADSPKLVMQKFHEIVLIRMMNQVSIEVDGHPALRFVERAASANGKFGLYVEDAAAVIQSIWISYPTAVTAER